MIGFCLKLNSKTEIYVNLILTMSNRESNTALDPLFIHPHLTSGLNTLFQDSFDTYKVHYRQGHFPLNILLSTYSNTVSVFHDKPLTQFSERWLSMKALFLLTD